MAHTFTLIGTIISNSSHLIQITCLESMTSQRLVIDVLEVDFIQRIFG